MEVIPEQWTSSLTAGSRKFRKVWDRTGRRSQNQIYMCVMRMILKSWYITWEGSQRKKDRKLRAKKIKKYIAKRRTLDSWLNDSGYADDDFYISFSSFFFQTTHDRYLISKVRLVLFPTLYKFIVWAYWAKTQPCLGSKPKLILTTVLNFLIAIHVSTINICLV